MYNLFSSLLDYMILNLKKSGQDYQFFDSGPINTLFTEFPGTYLSYTDVKNATRNWDSFRIFTGKSFMQSEKRVGCLLFNGAPHHETYGGLD